MRQPVLRVVQQAIGHTGRPQATKVLAMPATQQPQKLLSRPFSSTMARSASTTITSNQKPTSTRSYSSTASSPEAASSSSTPSVTIPSLATVFQKIATPAAPGHPSLYATVHIHGRPYLVTAGDRLRLPFRIQGVQAGDELRLDRIGVVGSREVTVKAGPPQETVKAPGTAGVPGASVSAVVLGLESEPMRLKIKTKRRNRKQRRIRSKHFYTVLRIQDVLLDETA